MYKAASLIILCLVLHAQTVYGEDTKRIKKVDLGLTKQFVESIYTMSRTEWKTNVLEWRKQGLAVDMSSADDTLRPFKKVQNIVYLTMQTDNNNIGSVSTWISPTYTDENTIADIQFNWLFRLPYDGLNSRDMDLICYSSMEANKKRLAPDFDGLFKCNPPTNDNPSYWFQIFLYRNN